MSTIKNPEDYVMPFGKFKGLRAVEVVKVVIADKNGVDQPIGLKYLEWLCEQDWFKDTQIIRQVIVNNEMEEDSEPKKKQSKPKAEPKKKELTKRVNPYVLSSDSEDEN